MTQDQPNQDLTASITPRGSLENLGRAPIHLSAEDSATVKESMLAELSRGGEIIAIRRDTIDGRATAVDKRDDGSTTTVTTGHMRSKKERELEACGMLHRHLKGKGAAWGPLIHTGESEVELGYDCMAELEGSPTTRLLMQHTQAHHDPDLSRDLAKGQLSHSAPPDELAKNLWSAIEAKAPKAIQGLTLVLDATDLGAHALPVVVAAFLEKYREHIPSLPFRGIWLVGPSDTLIFNLAGADV